MQTVTKLEQILLETDQLHKSRTNTFKNVAHLDDIRETEVLIQEQYKKDKKSHDDILPSLFPTIQMYCSLQYKGLTKYT